METEPNEPAVAAFGGRIVVMPYTHADIAWVHSRAWHIDRYVRVMDEVLALFEADPSYCYYIDTWVELMRPYAALRPGAVAAVRRRIREGRLAVCGGQYGNVRSTAVGDETQVRNLQRGMVRWKEVAPEAEFRVHSNIDVTLGHTQMPQLLRLAGIEAYFVMRPLAALDAQAIPRAFHWQGLSGERILVYRDSGVGLFQEHERCGPTWESDWPAVVRHIGTTYLDRPASEGLPAIGLSVGVDDSRPDRFSFTDAHADYGALIRLWNERQRSAMAYGTPDTLVAALETDAHRLPVVDAVLDPTCVHFNLALNGRRGIWWLRERADRLLVASEIVAALAQAAGKAAFPEAEFTREWEGLLDWTPHAVQWLFRPDWQQGELALRNVADAAQSQGEKAAAALVGGCLPGDGAGIALVNTLPRTTREIVPLWVLNSDLTRGFVGLRDARGRAVPVQVIGFPTVASEVMALAEVDLPAGGYATFALDWESAPTGLTYPGAEAHWRERYRLPQKQALGPEPFTLESDCLAITLEGGHVVAVGERRAPPDASFLEPVCYPITRTGWSSDALPDAPERFVVESTRVDEVGPLRWRITRTGRVGGFWVRQHLDLYKGETAVRSTLQFLDPADERDALIGISVPIGDAAELATDIPFGIEPRAVEAIQYGISERAIPGLFWGKTWVEAADGGGRIALLAADGDRIFRAHGAPRRLTHILAQKTRLFEESWEALTNLGDLGGQQVFSHTLVVGATQTELVHRAERARHPVLNAYIPEARLGSDISLLSVAPETISLSALVWEDGALLVRLVQMARESVEAEITLPFPVASATAVDFRGRPRPDGVVCAGNRIRLSIDAWQIATLRVQRRGEEGSDGATG